MPSACTSCRSECVKRLGCEDKHLEKGIDGHTEHPRVYCVELGGEGGVLDAQHLGNFFRMQFIIDDKRCSMNGLNQLRLRESTLSLSGRS